MKNLQTYVTMEYQEMKDRIAHIIRAKNLTAAEFAMQLGIQPSNVSHLLAGRNNPSLDFVKKLKETFPEYNLDWIVMGKGPMTVSEPFVEQKPPKESLFMPQTVENDEENLQGTLFSPEKVQEQVVGTPVPLPTESVQSVGVKHIVMVYDDNSFEILSPR
jgi:transcriptional regulator with XRE-family HTH domain